MEYATHHCLFKPGIGFVSFWLLVIEWIAYSGYCNVYLGKCSNSEMCFLLVHTSMDENSLIKSYFWDGFGYHAILRFLTKYHWINISYITLCRRLRDLVWLGDSSLLRWYRCRESYTRSYKDQQVHVITNTKFLVSFADVFSSSVSEAKLL